MYPRHLRIPVHQALQRSPVVLLGGARQTGKSTLVQQTGIPFPMPFPLEFPRRYVTLDDLPTLQAARSDPAGFIAGLGDSSTIDEVQRVPDLMIAIKAAVDRDRRPGRFLLTGSADVLTLPKVAESLAGRMELLYLWPLSQGEILHREPESFVDRLFEAIPVASEAIDFDGLLERILVGGYPEVVRDPLQRGFWFDAYVTTVLQREVRAIANIDRLEDMPRLLAVLAARATGLLNKADISRTVGLSQSSLDRYLTLLDQAFLIRRVRPWHANVGKRLVKSPKVLLSDPGLLAHLLGLSPERIGNDRSLLGPLLESFVGMELIKQIGWSDRRPSLFHVRTDRGIEVDFALEDRLGNFVGIEVKATGTPRSDDFKGLHQLADWLGPRFIHGVVLYTGTTHVPFGERLAAIPVSSLWAAEPRPAAGHAMG